MATLASQMPPKCLPDSSREPHRALLGPLGVSGDPLEASWAPLGAFQWSSGCIPASPGCLLGPFLGFLVPLGCLLGGQRRSLGSLGGVLGSLFGLLWGVSGAAPRRHRPPPPFVDGRLKYLLVSVISILLIRGGSKSKFKV